jgi:hypothetical protein
MVVVFNTIWDPLHILQMRPVKSLLENYYGYEPPLSPERIGALLSMKPARTWRSGGLEVSLLTAESQPRDTAELCTIPPCARSN